MNPLPKRLKDDARAHLQDDVVSDEQPITELGKKLLALRRAWLASGGKPLSADQLDEEMRERRGGLMFAEKNLAEDWLRAEEDEAWAHLQQARPGDHS
ncbi:hypothetical protein [Methylococcus sp. Mc7]|uniref:hypothetical protein n=1 Tax=Methylococcus sp. Mc7 TaxID=2860258 RepID=UPI001C5291B4|nr:hypothetical protein [Methylococcus sp. Mc7]QXP83431.1 hypothetical protein KW115_14825 [Methylococcus sp. Mc7]